MPQDARRARQGNRAELMAALQASRADTLATFAAFEHALPGLRVPLRAELNPPLWELGHIGWFQDWWLARNPERLLGKRADPLVPRLSAERANADALYDSSHVPHDSRWSLPLPDAEQTRADLAAQLQRSLALLQSLDRDDDEALYFFRLALLHEDMHHEAGLYMARGLDLAVTDPRWQAQPLPEPPAALHLEAGPWRLGMDPGQGFAFDNEVPAHELALPACEIDAQPLRWAEFLPFVEEGGYRDARWWTREGWHWLQSAQAQAPRYLRREAGRWWCRDQGQWQPLDTRLAATHLSLHEAHAWCAWASRCLPTEAQWERAACTRPDSFRWGQAWEWTASPFAPFDGFAPHPYRDYSAPWFDGRPVLRGASPLTQPRMRHPRYRNFFQPWRHDVPAGFRSCAAAPAA